MDVFDDFSLDLQKLKNREDVFEKLEENKNLQLSHIVTYDTCGQLNFYGRN